MRSKILILTVVLLFAVLLSGCGPALVAQAQGTVPPTQGVPAAVPHTLSVSGSGKAYLDPDIAYITVGVHTENKDAAEAVASNNTRSQKVADALKNLKIDPKDIQTTNFSIYPQQQYDTQGKLTGTTYMVDNSVYITLRDLSKLGDVLDAVITAGANSINGIQFDVADKTKALSDARKSAVADAQGQAQELASAAGVQLGAIQSINTSASQPPVPIYSKGLGGGVAAAEQAATVPVSAGQLIVTIDVNIVYEIK